MRKKSLLFLTSFFLCLTFLIVSIPVFSASSVVSENVTYRIEGNTLFLEGKGDLVLTYEFIPEIPWYEHFNNIEAVVVGEGITTLGEGTFALLSHLKTVSLPSTLHTVGPSAFLSCSSLETLVLPDSVTRIENGAFVGCESLQSLTIPGNVYFISSDAFYNCLNLTIRGIRGSYAETVANQHNIPFDASLPTPKDIVVTLNNNILTFDQPPVIINDRTLVPLRAIFEALGADVKWNPNTRTVSATRGDIKISLVVDTKILTKNGKNIEIDVPATIVNDRTMVPARAISEALGASVDWDPFTRTVLIFD